MTLFAPAQHTVIGNTDGTGANLRAAPSMTSEKALLADGTVVRPTGQTRSAESLVWAKGKVEPHGRAGWVATKYLVDSR